MQDGLPIGCDNTVELLGVYGGDDSHALSAWTSTSRELSDTKRQRIPALLKMLADNGHHTPFEKSSIHFLVSTEIASHVHLIKHRIGVSVNAESARYKELLDDKYYIPNDWHAKEVEEYVAFMHIAFAKYHEVLERLVARGVPRGRAKESARFYLPYGNQIKSDVMFNFRSFMHFCGLRYSLHAQKEIRDIARKMLQFVLDTGQFNQSLQAFGYLNENGSLRDPT
jgi:flavin-dependent thymidylate synthase